MKNFLIFVQGENFNVEVEGKVQPAGFFASRRAEAKTEEDAAENVVQSLLDESEIKGKALENHTMEVKLAHEMPIEHKNKYHGFTFYPMEEV